MTQIKPVTKRINSSTTTTVIATSCVVFLIVIACSNAGTAWTLEIRDKAGTPNVWVPAFYPAVPTDGKIITLLNLEQDFPLPMDGGIDIITSGTPGVVSVCMILGTNA
jgi:hypothetical protein